MIPNTMQAIREAVQETINKMSPQDLMQSTTLLDFCNRYKIEKEWK